MDKDKKFVITEKEREDMIYLLNHRSVFSVKNFLMQLPELKEDGKNEGT